MHFGFEIIPDISIWQNISLSILAERSGFTRIWVTDHYYNQDPLIVLPQLSNYLKTAQIGPGILSPLLYHPVYIARFMATLASLTKNPPMLGIGPGDKTALSMIGQQWGQIISQLQETLEIIRALFQQDPVNWSGDHYHLQNVQIRNPKKPPKIYLAAQGPKLCELAGKIADGVLINACSCDQLKIAMDHIRRGQKQRNIDTPLDNVASLLISYGPTREEAYRNVKGLAGMIIAGSPPSFLRRLNISETIVNSIQFAMKQQDYELLEELIPESIVDLVAIAGTQEDLLSKLTQIKQIGVNGVTIATPNNWYKTETLKVFKEEIIPQLQ